MSPYLILVVVAVALGLAIGIPLAAAGVARARASTDREWLDLCRFTLKTGSVDDLKAVAEATRPRHATPLIIQVNDRSRAEPSPKSLPTSTELDG